MPVLKVTIQDRLLNKVLHLLDPFKGKGVEIEQWDTNFDNHAQHVLERLKWMDAGKAEYMSLEEMDKRLEETIQKHKNSDS